MNKFVVILFFSSLLSLSAKIPSSSITYKFESKYGNNVSLIETNKSDHAVVDTTLPKYKSEIASSEKMDKYTKMGKLSLIFGASSFAAALIPYLGIISFPLAIAAIVLGIVSLKNKQKNNTSAIVGVSLGFGFIVIFLIALIVLLSIVAVM